MLTATVLLRLVTTMTAVRHLGTTMTAMAAVAAAAEEEADITRRGHMTEGEVWTVMLAAGPRGTTALGTHTGMTGTVARATGQGGLAPPAHSTGIPGRVGITEAEAGAMRGHQDLHCLQDQLWLQDTERRMHSQEIDESHHGRTQVCWPIIKIYVCEIISRSLSQRFLSIIKHFYTQGVGN